MLTNKAYLFWISWLFIISNAQATLKEKDLETISQQFSLEAPIFFKPLIGGIANAPIYVFTKVNGKEIPFGVLKKEKYEKKLTLGRLRILEEMKELGFAYLPNIIKNIEDEYLTNIDGEKYSCFEYLLPDSQEENISFSSMVELIGKFHFTSITLKNTNIFETRKLDDFKRRKHFFLNQLLKEKDPNLFEIDIWKQITNLSDFYASTEFEKIYRSLPSQVIHGDTHAGNVIKSKGQFYLIDFDNMNYDVRLWDLACCISFSFFNEFLEKIKNRTWSSYIESHYELSGIVLEHCEKKYLFELVKFRKMEVMAWFLEMMYLGIIDHNEAQYKQFREALLKQTADVHQLMNETFFYCNG